MPRRLTCETENFFPIQGNGFGEFLHPSHKTYTIICPARVVFFFCTSIFMYCGKAVKERVCIIKANHLGWLYHEAAQVFDNRPDGPTDIHW